MPGATGLQGRRAELVIFDCDGVLVDSETLSHQVLVDMLGEWGARISFDDAVRRFIGASVPQMVVRVTDLLGRPPPEHFLDEMAARCRAAYTANLQPVPGVVQVLQGLCVPCCVASNGGHAKMSFTLGLTGLLPRFAGRIYSAEDVAHAKPAPDLFLHAARSLGVLPEATLVVEDTPTGIAAAKAAGMWALGYAAMTPPDRLLAAGADAIAGSMAEAARHLHTQGAHA